MPRRKKNTSFTSRLKSFLFNPITPIISLLVSYIVIRNQQLMFHSSSGTTLTDFNLNGVFDDANSFDRFIFNHNTEHILTDDYPQEDYLNPDEPINIDDPSGPEILLTMIDDVGASTLTEESYITSSNIKKFIHSGTTIAGGAKAYPTCTPSRAAFLSGRQPATPQAALGGYPFPAIYPGPPTLIDMLHKRGFYVIQGGKWHLGHAMNAYMPNGGYYGIDYFFGKLQGGGQHMSDKNGCFPLLNGLDMFRLYKNGSVEVICDKDLVNVHSTDFYADEIIKQIRLVRQENPKQHIAVLFTPQAAHSPTAVSQMNPVDYETCSHLTNPTSRSFCSMVESVARNHLRIVAALEETSIAPPLKKAVIEAIFSDNGGKPTSGADNCVRNSTICYRGGKASNWEGGMRVPGIFKGPHIPENKEVDTLFHITDIYPTLKGLLDAYWGIETPAIPGLYGIDQSALILGKQENIVKRDKVLAQFDPYQKCWVYISGNFKLMFGPTGDGYLYHNDGPNLESDSGYPYIDHAFQYLIERTENSKSTVSAFLTELLAGLRILLLDTLTGNNFANPLLKRPGNPDQLRLYDLANDPKEIENLVFANPQIVRSLLIEAMDEINQLKPFYNYNGRDTKFAYTSYPNKPGVLVHGPWREALANPDEIELEPFLKRFVENQMRQFLWDKIHIISGAFAVVFAAGYFVHGYKAQQQQKRALKFFDKTVKQVAEELEEERQLINDDSSSPPIRYRTTL